MSTPQQDKYYLGTNHPTPRDHYLAPGDYIDISAIDVAAEIKWFEEKYQAAIKLLRETHDDVFVGWGIHCSY